MRFLSSAVLSAALILPPIQLLAAVWSSPMTAHASRPAARNQAALLLVEQADGTVPRQFDPASPETNNDKKDDEKGRGNSGDSAFPPKKCPPGHGGENDDGEKNCRKHKSGDDGDSRSVPVWRSRQVS
jgi:hypothetical protein